MSIDKLKRAQKNKNDEFYTRYEDVANEMQHYAQYFVDKTWGINLDITVGCDLTDFIVDQRWLFQDVLMKQMAVDALREFVYNPNVRTNRHSVNAGRTEILYEIDGDSSSMRESGLAYELKQALGAVSLATSGINRVCLPCCNHGLRYKPI